MFFHFRQRMLSTNYPKDVLLFLFLIPVINSINYYLTYPQIDFNGYFVLTFTIDTLQGYAAWFGIREVIVWLDKKTPYQERIVGRIVLQLLLTLLVGLLIIIGLTILVNSLASKKPVPLFFYTHNLFIFAIWILVVNGIYIGWYFFKSWQKAVQQQNQAENVESKTSGFFVKSGKQNLLIPFSAILYIWVDGNYTLLYTDELRKYFVDFSLDKLEEQMPADFFRLNRKFIAHRQAIQGYQRLENGKLEVLFQGLPGLPPKLTVSRTKAPDFKRWFNV